MGKLRVLPRPERVLSATRSVEEQLREAILRLEFLPGTRLSESEIAARYDVSRQPAREAILALSRLELLRVLPQRGTVVTKISTRYMMQVRIAREALETAIVVRACERFDPVVRASIDALIDTQRRAAATGDHLLLSQADSQFHAALAAGADCELIWRMVLDTKIHMDRVRHLTLQDRASMQILVEQHRAIMDAIDSRDPERAIAAMRRHLLEILSDLPRVMVEHADLFE